jgi:hypothetical protein
MITKYKIFIDYACAEIDAVKVLSETKCFVEVASTYYRPYREAKQSTMWMYYDTWEDAHTALEHIAARRIHSAKRGLESAQEFRKAVESMSKPVEQEE